MENPGKKVWTSDGARMYAMTETIVMTAKNIVKTESIKVFPFSSLSSKYPMRNGMRTEAETVEAMVV